MNKDELLDQQGARPKLNENQARTWTLGQRRVALAVSAAELLTAATGQARRPATIQASH